MSVVWRIILRRGLCADLPSYGSRMLDLPSTTADDVVKLFRVTPAAEFEYDRWHGRHEHVVSHVMNHRAEALYRVKLSEVEEVCRQTQRDRKHQHALGEVDREVAESVTPVKNWRPDFAFTHVMHYVLETLGHLPTWLEFSRFLRDDETAHRMLGEPIMRKCHETIKQGYKGSQVWDALRWRVGNEYYSFVREVYTVAYLRAADLDVRAHPLADALFRVDAWMGRAVLNVYVRNAEYRDGPKGRKPRCQKFLGGANPEFQIVPLPLPKASEYGTVHLPPKDELDKTMIFLQKIGSSRF